MNKHDQEILNRFGEKLLKNIRSDFPQGFHIVAIDDDNIVVGNQVRNTAYSRTKFTAKNTHIFVTGVKLNRKVG